MTGPPMHSPLRCLHPDKYKIDKTSHNTSPLHVIPKLEAGAWKPCGDFQRLNTQSVLDKYLILHLQGVSIFTKSDLRKALHQIPVAKENIHKTAVTTPFGLFKFARMTFSLSNAAQSFQ